MKEAKKLWKITMWAVILKLIYVFSFFEVREIMPLVYSTLETIIIVGVSVILWYIMLKGGNEK